MIKTRKNQLYYAVKKKRVKGEFEPYGKIISKGFETKQAAKKFVQELTGRMNVKLSPAGSLHTTNYSVMVVPFDSEMLKLQKANEKK